MEGVIDKRFRGSVHAMSLNDAPVLGPPAGGPSTYMRDASAAR